jgi:thiol-disulfide isomerase/thioredoxin
MSFRLLCSITVSLIVAGVTIPGVGWGHQSSTSNVVESGFVGKNAPEIGDGKWINSCPLKLYDLRGKVVLVEFWTFGCYNCRNTILYLEKWYEKYRGEKFELIGVHSPEFEREKEFSALVEQARNLGITYPVVTDNDLKTWNAYNQEYWPVVYVIDKRGIVRYVHIGEGDYPVTERWIQDLLRQ